MVTAAGRAMILLNASFRLRHWKSCCDDVFACACSTSSHLVLTRFRSYFVPQPYIYLSRPPALEMFLGKDTWVKLASVE